MRLTVKEMAVFGMLAGLMFASKQIMEVLPNVHLLGVFTIAITLVYRRKALYPIYGFVLTQGLFSGFALWWIPYLYLWTVLWGAAMLLLPRDLGRVKPLQVMLLCAAHGYLYGTLYAPAQALLFGLDWKGMVTWILAGLPWDFVHGTSNFFCGLLILPLARALRRAEGYALRG